MKNKKFRIIVDLVLIIVGILFLALGIKDLVKELNSKTVNSAEKFASSYSSVDTDNVFEYISLKDLNKILNEKKALVFIGDKLDPWSQILAKPLNEVAKKTGIKINYVELNEQDFSQKEYSKVLSKLEIKKFNAPMVVFSQKDTNEYLNKDEIFDTKFEGAPIEYWTSEKLDEFDNYMSEKIEKLK